MTTTPHERLQLAREQAGYASAAAFAKSLDIPEPTYRAHENGTRALTIRAAKQYGPKLNISWQWLMFGDESSPYEDVTDEDLETLSDLKQLHEIEPVLGERMREMIRLQAKLLRERIARGS